MLAIAMTITLSGISVFAADHSITITQDENVTGTLGAETYNLYKIFDVTKTGDVEDPVTTDDTLGPGTAKGFAYTISTSNPWFAVLGTVSGGAWTPASGQTWVTLQKAAGSTDVYNVTWAGDNTKAAAIEFADWLKANKGSIAADKTATSSGGVATVTVDDGYWLVDSTLGTNLVLATTDINIHTKNQYPATEKSVAKTNYSVGDLVDYTITVNLPASVDYTKPVIVHDTMDDVLGLKTDSVSAKVGEDDFTSHVTLIPSNSFPADHDNTSHAAATGKVLYDFAIDISSLAPPAGQEPVEKTVTISYKAELLSTALADTEYVNKEFVEYSEYKTPVADAKIKTFDFQLKKTFDGKTKADLAATFELSDSAGHTIEFIKDTTGYVKKDSDDTGAIVTLTVNGESQQINLHWDEAREIWTESAAFDLPAPTHSDETVHVEASISNPSMLGLEYENPILNSATKDIVVEHEYWPVNAHLEVP